MLSKAKTKYIRSLELKKNRLSEDVFVAEGPKVVGDLLTRFRPRLIVATQQWFDTTMRTAHYAAISTAELVIVTPDELERASFLRAPQEVLAVFEMEALLSAPPTLPSDTLTLVLDDVQDPGNVGTIIRTADWFGIRQIICSQGTADAFSPKVVQATMGALARVGVYYTDLTGFLAKQPKGTPVYGTFLEGTNIYRHPLSQHGIIIMGNEGNGISPAVSRFVTQKLFIPPYPAIGDTSESLNVAIATAVTLAEFRRRAAL